MSLGGGAARSDLRGGVGWMVLGLVIALAAWRMERFESMGATLYSAPGMVPGLFGAVLVVLGGALAWRGWRGIVPAGESTEGPGPLLNRRIGWMLLLALGYAALAVGRLPFWLATAAFVAAFCALFSEREDRRRRLAVALLAGALTALGVVLVFERVFLVRLP
jgi:hypothetical protein